MEKKTENNDMDATWKHQVNEEERENIKKKQWNNGEGGFFVTSKILVTSKTDIQFRRKMYFLYKKKKTFRLVEYFFTLV